MIPSLIHPVPVHLRRKNVAASTFDARGREPVRQLWRAGDGPGTGVEAALEGQLNWNDGKIKRPKLPAGSGAREESDGYVLFRVVDLVSAGVATENADGTVDFGIVRGDKIVRVGRRVVSLYVTFLRDVAGYDDQGGGTLLEVNFKDRAPATAG